MRRLRNEIAHGAADHKSVLTADVVSRSERVATELERLARESPPA